MQPMYLPNLTRKQWRNGLFIALGLKVILFAWFMIQVQNHWEDGKVLYGIAGVQGDTRTYFNPAEDLAQGKGYTSICRMPGVVPLYTPYSWAFGEGNATVLFIVFQWILSILSVVILGWIAVVLYRDERVFYWTISFYGISTFVSVWDHFLMTDSLSVSTIIFSIFFFIQVYPNKQRLSTYTIGCMHYLVDIFTPNRSASYPSYWTLHARLSLEKMGAFDEGMPYLWTTPYYGHKPLDHL